MTALVLKIGGSLAKSGQLSGVLEMVARSTRRIVIVPGGGSYADLVRQEQATLGYSDAEAHRRAILAMHRMAAEWIDMQPRLASAETVQEIRAGWQRHMVPVWLPARMVLGDLSLPEDWSVTSDALAARLSECLGRVPVVLVKSLRVPRSARADALAAQGIVDPVFAKIVARSGSCWRIVGADERAELGRFLK